MRHRLHTFKIGRSGAHRRAMLANMVSSLIENGEIKTTLTKAKEARRFAEKMVTMGKKGDLHRRRLAVAKLRSKSAVKKLFDEVSPQYAERDGGYTRIIKLGQRKGDAAEMCLLQFVQEELNKKSKKEAAPKVAEDATEEKAETAPEVAEDATEENAEEASEVAEAEEANEKKAE